MERSPLLEALHAVGLLEPPIQRKITEYGFHTVEDLRFALETSVEACECGLEVPWRWTLTVGTSVMVNAMSVVDTARSQSSECQHNPAYIQMPRILKKVKQTKFKAANSPAADAAAREEAARKAVSLSVSWGEKGLKAKFSSTSESWILRKVKSLSRYEPRVILGAMTCWQRWVEWCAENVLEPLEGEVGDWEHFMENRSGAATMPRTTWCQAEWLRVHLMAPIPTDKISKPPKRVASEKVGFVLPEEQAPVADPELLLHFESMVVGMLNTRDSNLGCVLAALVSAYSGPRHAHLARSRLVCITNNSVCALAFKGKRNEGGARPAFNYHFPRHGCTGVDFGGILWELWNELCKKTRKVTNAIVLDFTTGATVSLAHFNSVLHNLGSPIMSHLNESKVLITSYWFRSVGATLADMRRAPWHERLPLGDWKGGKPVAVGNEEHLMPIRYSRSKSQTEKYVKRLHVLMLSRLLKVVKSPVEWESCRNAIEGTDIGHLRSLVAEELDREHEPTLAYGHKDLPAGLKGVRKIRLLSRRRNATQELVDRISSGSNAGDVAVCVSGDRLPLMDTPEAKTPDEGNKEALSEAEPVADEEIVRQYGWAAGNRANSVLHFTRNDSDGNMPICAQRKKGGQPFSLDASGRDLGGVAGVDKELCTACLACVPQGVLDFLSLVCNTKQCDKLDKRIRCVWQKQCSCMHPPLSEDVRKVRDRLLLGNTR